MLPCKVSFSLLHGYTILLSNFGLLYTFVIFGLPPVISRLFPEKEHTKFQFTIAAATDCRKAYRISVYHKFTIKITQTEILSRTGKLKSHSTERKNVN